MIRIAPLAVALIASPSVAQQVQPVTVQVEDDNGSEQQGEDASSMDPAAFDLSSFGGVEESTAANGARVRRPVAPEGQGEEVAAQDAPASTEGEPPSFDEAVALRRQEREEQAPYQWGTQLRFGSTDTCNDDPDLINPTSCFVQNREAARAARLAAGGEDRVESSGTATRTTSNCTQTANGFRCSGSVTTGTSEEARQRAQEALDQLLDDD